MTLSDFKKKKNLQIYNFISKIKGIFPRNPNMEGFVDCVGTKPRHTRDTNRKTIQTQKSNHFQSQQRCMGHCATHRTFTIVFSQEKTVPIA
jgi:hypothetical protein